MNKQTVGPFGITRRRSSTLGMYTPGESASSSFILTWFLASFEKSSSS